MRDLITSLSWIGVLTLIIAVLSQSKTDIYGFPSCWGIQYATHGQDRGIVPVMGTPFVLGSIEGFTGNTISPHVNTRSTNSPTPPTIPVKGVVEKTDGPSGSPAAFTPTGSYSLLTGVLPEKTKPGDLTAKSCYKTDFLAHTDKVGNYIQRTNNFRHGNPDSCSSPLTEFVQSFY